MKMSAYRQRTPVFQLEHGACIAGATTKQDVELVEMALSTEKPVLIGLDGQVTILKSTAQGDEGHTFEALYDYCITLLDLKKVHDRGVKTPDELPLEKHQVILSVRFEDAELELKAMMVGKNHGDLRKRLRDLLNDDSAFRDQLTDQIAFALIHQQTHTFVGIRDVQLMNEPCGEDDPLWEFPGP